MEFGQWRGSQMFRPGEQKTFKSTSPFDWVWFDLVHNMSAYREISARLSLAARADWDNQAKRTRCTLNKITKTAVFLNRFPLPTFLCEAERFHCEESALKHCTVTICHWLLNISSGCTDIYTHTRCNPRLCIIQPKEKEGLLKLTLQWLKSVYSVGSGWHQAVHKRMKF